MNFFNIFLFPFLGNLKSESYPDKLSAEDEERYLNSFKNGSREARDKLILHNLRLVAHIVKKYESTNESKDDLLSIGAIGLIKGVDTYKFDNNNKISTYLARCIENEILMHLRSNKNKNNNLCLNQEIKNEKDGNEIKLIDLISDDSKPILDKLIEEEKIKALNKALRVLDDFELDIISRRYGINGRKLETQKEIAKSIGISRSYVSRIEKRALMKLFLELKE